MADVKTRTDLMNMLKPRWFNSDPLIVSVPDEEGKNNIYIINESLKHKVMLIDFWDYTCINCIRTVPYVNKWHERYAKLGLVIIGVHTPEFSVSTNRDNIGEAVKKFGITYPVVMDNDYGIWTGLQNQYWPRKILFNSRLEVIHDRIGEGGYKELETKIQHALLEMSPGITLPQIMEPIRNADIPGIRCYPVTPELYCGFERGQLGNSEGYNKNSESVMYTLPEKLEEDRIYLNGSWAATEESIIATALPSSVELLYRAVEVNAVMSSLENGRIKVYVEIDKNPVEERAKGEDIMYDESCSYILVEKPRMYNITKNQLYKQSLITLTPENAALEVFAFTFVSCVEPN